MSEAFDLAVVGAGPGGYPAAFRAADLGMRVALIDPEPNPGGVCLYRGCVPSKALLHVADFLTEARAAQEWGVSVGEVTLDRVRLRAWKDAVVGKLTAGVGQLAQQRGVRYVRGLAHFTGPHSLSVETLEGEGSELAFEHAVLASGSVSVRLPDAVAAASPRIITSSEALDLGDVPARLLVVGAGYIGLELGQLYACLGSRVSVVEMLPEILPGADRDLARFLERRLARQFEAIMTGTRVVKMEERDDGIAASFEGQTAGSQRYDKVMVAVGRKPLTADTGIENTAITLDERGFVQVDAQRRTAEPSIFAVGDVAGQPMLAHKATHEGVVAAEAAAGRSTVFNPKAIPAVVFSDPEVAWCGLMEAEARRAGRAVKVTTFPWSASGRATTLARNDGVTKLVCGELDGRVLGVGIAGHGAGELLAEGVLAVELGAVAEDLALAIHTHPTLSETLMEAAQAIDGKSTHFLRR